MSSETEIAKLYKQKQIESASPGRLIVLLYDATIEFLVKAEKDFEAQGPSWIEDFHNSLIGAQNIITELLVALDVEKGGEVAKNLFRLYEYMNHELVEANMNKTVEPVETVRGLLETLRDAWVEVQDSVSSGETGPIPEGTGLNLQG